MENVASDTVTFLTAHFWSLHGIRFCSCIVNDMVGSAAHTAGEQHEHPARMGTIRGLLAFAREIEESLPASRLRTALSQQSVTGVHTYTPNSMQRLTTPPWECGHGNGRHRVHPISSGCMRNVCTTVTSLFYTFHSASCNAAPGDACTLQAVDCTLRDGPDPSSLALSSSRHVRRGPLADTGRARIQSAPLA